MTLTRCVASDRTTMVSLGRRVGGLDKVIVGVALLVFPDVLAAPTDEMVHADAVPIGR